ncbi:1-phosphatidylinositol-4-phosphate 5-kinase [Sugiyamaella lignohabitans]|uniref:1-phosphatidylinositol-4-phosphate 5-kinase n=1 Tax=Sugiyamaella lignohabitans TaxID=796027 RepID=A0A167C578_9ASCO|nr:1-phosphatidylinositol-4-phosphate 5-kinase [Sugiyamaella lignohabitans]ANB11232.1 1-phosphatidylinositol-4-phosphate 5-kinase [Sugiyamaella lignohabitans]
MYHYDIPLRRSLANYARPVRYMARNLIKFTDHLYTCSYLLPEVNIPQLLWDRSVQSKFHSANELAVKYLESKGYCNTYVCEKLCEKKTQELVRKARLSQSSAWSTLTSAIADLNETIEIARDQIDRSEVELWRAIRGVEKHLNFVLTLGATVSTESIKKAESHLSGRLSTWETARAPRPKKRVPSATKSSTNPRDTRGTRPSSSHQQKVSIPTTAKRSYEKKTPTRSLRTAILFDGVYRCVCTSLTPGVSHISSPTIYAVAGGTIEGHSQDLFNTIRRLQGIRTSDYLSAFDLNSAGIAIKSPGRSGSDLLYTENGKYIIKTIPSSEHEVLIDLLPSYVEHLERHKNSLLPVFLGHYTHEDNGKRTHFVVMKNLFSGHGLVDKVFDLKGSTYNRAVDENTDNVGRLVYKDIEWMKHKETIQMNEEERTKFMIQLMNDIAFLKRNNIFDYSMLVGKYDDSKKGVMGIIDILTPYNKPQALKRTALGLLHDPTTLSCMKPCDYAARFFNFMESKVVPAVITGRVSRHHKH